ncbi:hypothetical protein EON65_50545 [archaeon]|nr:MAG: hypothetical protein EON65_50545 [archaeon]
MGQLELAIIALNTSGVAQPILHPANISWRATGDRKLNLIELRLVNFEDAQLFGQVIVKEYVEAMVRRHDVQYRFTRATR